VLYTGKQKHSKMAEQQKPWSVDYFERARPHMTSWVKEHLLPHINSPGHAKISIKAPVKSGKREIVEYVAQRDSVSGNEERAHAFISSWHRTADADQRTELGQQNLKVFSTTSHKNVELCKNWIREQLRQKRTVVAHLDECDYATAPLQILSNLWYFIRGIGDDCVVKVILYSATPEEVIYASAREAEDEQQRELLHEILVTTQLIYTPPEGYCGSARFIEEGLVVNAMPFFEKKQGAGGYAISQQGRHLIEEFNAALQLDPSKNCIVLRLSYCEGGHKIENKAFHQFINHIDTFTELHGFSVICDKAEGLKLKKSANVTVRADRIEWSERSYWDDLAEGPKRKFLFVIDQTSSRSTEWACHDRIHAYHDFRHTAQYATISQAQERVDHYAQRYGNTFQRIKVYGHLPTFKLSAGVITYDQYFQNAWERRKITSRRDASGDNESVGSSGSISSGSGGNGESNEAMYLVRESVSKRRHPDCPETGMNTQNSARLLQQLGCWADTSISSRVAGKPKQVPEYKGYWYPASRQTWSTVWEQHCTRLNITGVTRSNVRNPFDNAESRKHEDGRSRGLHRTWRVLKWNQTTEQLFDIDNVQEQPQRIDDLGSTGGERNKVCYNERGQPGVLIVRPTGNYITKNHLVSVNTMYAAI
jgi:hypothetical protein